MNARRHGREGKPKAWRATSQEESRLAEDASGRQDWRLRGTDLPERQWSTVREGHPADRDAWGPFPRDMSRLRADRWSEDGMLGWTERGAWLRFSVASWTGRDAHPKGKLFGTGWTAKVAACALLKHT